MIDTQYITLNMVPSGVVPILHCSQYDIGRPLGLIVYNGNEVVDLSEYACSLEATRTDHVAITAPVTTSGNVGTFITTATMTNKADKYDAQLVLITGGKRVASLPFIMHVIESAMDENASGISESRSLYQQFTAMIQSELHAVVGSPLVASSTSAMTDRGRVYVYTGSESGYTYGNWYYWNGSAWVSGGVYNSTAINTDESLSVSGMAADAKAVGNQIDNIDHQLDYVFASMANETEKTEDSIDEINSKLDYLTVLEAADLVDEDGVFLIDNIGRTLTGSILRMRTDPTGEQYGIAADAGMVGKTYLMGLPQMGLPIMYLRHPDIETLQSKNDGDLTNVDIVFESKGISTTLKKIKVQGASSQAYPKKNYTITFEDNVVLNTSWGAHKKYVIKADWVDFSHMRNEIGAKLWGAIRKTRINTERDNLVDNDDNIFVNASGDYLTGETAPQFSMGMNYGAVDGYPICVFINGRYWGIYSLMVPKDDWMAGMTGANIYEAIIAAEDHTTSTQFREKVTAPNEDGEMYPLTGDKVAFSMEYVTDEDDMGWLSTSINRIIEAANSSHSTDQEYMDALSPYIDIDSAIDYYIFSCLINNIDGLDKNYLLDTWDGTKWFFVAYDMDSIFGSDWNGKSYFPASGGATFQYYANRSKLMDVIYRHGKTALKARYEELRNGVLSESNVADAVWNYAVNIPKAAFNYEAVRWPSRPGTNTSNHEQILRYYSMRCTALDAEIEAL